MIIIMGKTASGKDTICNRLKKHGYDKLISYTTRPMRKNESEENPYHFITRSQFRRLIEQGFFLEYRTYETTEGIWYYGTSVQSYIEADNNTIVVLTPSGYINLCAALKVKPKCIYIKSDVESIKQRLIKRGDNLEEAKRRIETDARDFINAEELADFVVENNWNSNIDYVEVLIREKIKEWSE